MGYIIIYILAREHMMNIISPTTFIYLLKPSDINKFDELAARYINSPTKVAGVVMCLIFSQLYEKLPDMDDKIKLLSGLTACIVGPIGINGTRNSNLFVDIVFRLIFGAGFITMLHYLSIVYQLIIKSL